MSPYKSSKDKLSFEEIKNILKSNLQLYNSVYRNDPEFVEYFVELALYLLRYKYDRADEISPSEVTNEEEIPPPEPRVFQSGLVPTPSSGAKQFCHFCGAELQGERKCPVCGNIVF